MDTRNSEQRSRIMRSVKTKDTGPEMLVRRLLHRLGYRYRLHARDLPGRPDLVFRSRKKAVFVHGCFWHGHGCAKGKLPKSRLDYWGPKIEGNVARDAAAMRSLRAKGWKPLVVWQCECKSTARLQRRLIKFLDRGGIRSTSAGE